MGDYVHFKSTVLTVKGLARLYADYFGFDARLAERTFKIVDTRTNPVSYSVGACPPRFSRR